MHQQQWLAGGLEKRLAVPNSIPQKEAAGAFTMSDHEGRQAAVPTPPQHRGADVSSSSGRRACDDPGTLRPAYQPSGLLRR
jgi:hypothetical protein